MTQQYFRSKRNQAHDSIVKPGEFPFPLIDGPNESCFLTWLRNHSKYMAARGLFDYFRIVAVLVPRRSDFDLLNWGVSVAWAGVVDQRAF